MPTSEQDTESVTVQSLLARQAYSLLLRSLTPFYLLRLWRRGKAEPLYRAHWPARLGSYEPGYRAQIALARTDASAAHAPLVWVHAVSLGETLAARPLVAALRAQLPGMRLLLTHSTATGMEAGRALLQGSDLQTWLPYDTPGAVRRFLRAHTPNLGVLMETEIWPNVLHEAGKLGVPMVLANARLSDKSLRQGQRFAALLRPAAHSLALALAQTDADAERLRLAGVSQVQVCGNVKFDISPEPELIERGLDWAAADTRPIILAAVTREGEEQDLLDDWGTHHAEWHGLPFDQAHLPRLMIVPRHPQRFDEVARLITDKGLSLSRRSTWEGGRPDAAALAADVWLGDSMGEMAAYCAAAKVALLGGSFAPLGGQNLIEAAACGCPMVMGPHTFNFAEAAALSIEAGAGVRVQTFTEALNEADSIIRTERQPDMVEAAQAFAQRHRGAAQRMARALGQFWRC